MRSEATTNHKGWRLWLGGTFLAAAALVGMKEAYPFTPFPMYSRIDAEADALRVTDQNDRTLAISSLFDVGSAQAKKRFEKELLLAAKTLDYENATPEEARAAAGKFLANLWAGRKKAKSSDITRLKARMVTVTLAPEGGFRHTERLLGEMEVLP